MKNTNNKSLNDLFRAARDEASTELISDREAEQLLVNSAMRSFPTKQTIGQQLYGLLFSTPLKIGITTMTTATCIALGIFAFWPQTSATNNSLASQGTKTTQGTYGTNMPHETDVASPKNTPLTINGQAPAFNREEALPTAPAAPIATADSLHPIELSPEQLAQLGIVLEDNGDIDFYTKSKTTGEVNKFGLPPTWGVRLHLGEKISEADIAGVTIPKSAPRLITEPNGAKRLFSFESDTTITNTDGHNKMVMSMEKNVNIAPGGGNDSIQIMVNKMVANMLKNVQITPDINGDSLQIIVNNMVKRMLKNVQTTPGISSDSMQTIVNSSIVNGPSVHEVNVNSRVVNNGAVVKIFSDSNLSNGNKIDLDIDSNFDAQDKAMKFNVNTRVVINDDNEQSVDQMKADSADRSDFWAMDAIATNSINLDHLIPIRIRNTKNAEHPNELIFWYEPTPELTAAIPEASVSTPSQSKQLAISVYPNPTNGPATIHFDLASEPKAYFSVHNLLGQKVLDGGTTSGTSGDAKLDLSSLDAGVYLLVTTTDDGERDVERVVVAK